MPETGEIDTLTLERMDKIQFGSKLIEYTEQGAVFREDATLTVEEFETEIRQLARINRISQFCLGDLINAAEIQHGRKYDYWIEVTGFSRQTLFNICSVSRKIPFYRRRENLDWSSHAEVASIKDEEKREEILQMAEKHKLVREELRQTIRRGHLFTKKDIQREKENRSQQRDSQGEEPHGITLAKLSRWAEEAEEKHGNVNEWDRQVRAQLQQEFLGIWKFLNRLYG